MGVARALHWLTKHPAPRNILNGGFDFILL